MSRLLFVIFVLLLAGCTQTPQVAVPDVPQSQQALQQLTQWRLQGRMALQTPDEKLSASLNWRQNEQDFTLRLSTMLGITLLNMQQQNGQTRLSADGKDYQDNNASRLIERITGWPLPLTQLPLWVKGQTQPADIVEYTANGQVSRVYPQCGGCGDWQIDYADFQPVGEYSLPHKLSLTSQYPQAIKIKIRVNKWQH